MAGSTKTTSLSVLALADSRRRRDSSSPLASRLAAGVGVRVALPRNAAGRMGSGSTVTASLICCGDTQRVLGCALVTAAPLGGRIDSKTCALAIRMLLKQPGFTVDRCIDSGAGHRREHRDFRRRQ